MKRFDRDAALYIRPMYWAEAAAAGGVRPIRNRPAGACASSRRRCRSRAASRSRCRPSAGRPLNRMPVDAKAGASIPTMPARSSRRERAASTIACCATCSAMSPRLGTANVFMAKDGVVYTPAPNGTFLNGITRQRMIKLLRDDGVTVVEKHLRYRRFPGADEIFSTGNFSKVIAGHPHRRARAAAGPVLPQGARALLGIRPRVSGVLTARATGTLISRPRSRSSDDRAENPPDAGG